LCILGFWRLLTIASLVRESERLLSTAMESRNGSTLSPSVVKVAAGIAGCAVVVGAALWFFRKVTAPGCNLEVRDLTPNTLYCVQRRRDLSKYCQKYYLKPSLVTTPVLVAIGLSAQCM
jgi:hypothetical protein